MEAHGVFAAITSSSTFLQSQQRVVSADQLHGTQRSMVSSLVLQIGQLAGLSSDDATMLTDAIDASAFDDDAKGSLAAAVGARVTAAGTRTTAGPKGQSCMAIKDYAHWFRHSAQY